MKEIVSKNLIALAKEFEAKGLALYIVGGAVRNFLMGLPVDDIDICGSLTSEVVEGICKNLKFKCVTINKKLGTLLISINDEHFEYTTFRKENYLKGGKHSPESVEFVASLTEDAKRRDFTINAIYYNVLTGEYTDIYGGKRDIERKVIRCIETPEFVFSSDGLRLLRLTSFASTLNFKIERDTLKCAKKYAYQLKDISKERVAKELKQICEADYAYSVGKLTGIKLLNKLNLFKYIFNFSHVDFKVNTKNKYYKAFVNAEQSLRYKAFLLLVLLNYNSFKFKNLNSITYSCNRLFGNDGIKCGEDINSLIRVYVLLQECCFNKITPFTFVNYHNFNSAERNLLNVFCDKNLLSKGVLTLKAKGVPLNEKDLALSNAELMDLIEQKQVSLVKRGLFELCVQGALANTKEELIRFIKENNNIIKK